MQWTRPLPFTEAWRKRTYRPHFISELTDVQAEAAEVQVWLEFAHRVNYIDAARFDELFAAYEAIIAQTAVMSRDAHKWTKR